MILHSFQYATLWVAFMCNSFLNDFEWVVYNEICNAMCLIRKKKNCTKIALVRCYRPIEFDEEEKNERKENGQFNMFQSDVFPTLFFRSIRKTIISNWEYKQINVTVNYWWLIIMTSHDFFNWFSIKCKWTERKTSFNGIDIMEQKKMKY